MVCMVTHLTTSKSFSPKRVLAPRMSLLWQRMNVVVYYQLFVLDPNVVEAKQDGQPQGAADSYAMQCIDSVEI